MCLRFRDSSFSHFNGLCSFLRRKKSLHTPVTRRFQKVIAIFIIIYDLHSGSSYGFIEIASEKKHGFYDSSVLDLKPDYNTDQVSVLLDVIFLVTNKLPIPKILIFKILCYLCVFVSMYVCISMQCLQR